MPCLLLFIICVAWAVAARLYDDSQRAFKATLAAFTKSDSFDLVTSKQIQAANHNVIILLPVCSVTQE